ncbi:MAG: hypothetical protein VKL01_11225 [Limnothrix sp.]|nr:MULTISPECIES: hypothetical protein [unclassified Limnothrix]MEB3118927.1 hypothetical protein [Limnothrix sp.]
MSAGDEPTQLLALFELLGLPELLKFWELRELFAQHRYPAAI